MHLDMIRDESLCIEIIILYSFNDHLNQFLYIVLSMYCEVFIKKIYLFFTYLGVYLDAHRLKSVVYTDKNIK